MREPILIARCALFFDQWLLHHSCKRLSAKLHVKNFIEQNANIVSLANSLKCLQRTASGNGDSHIYIHMLCALRGFPLFRQRYQSIFPISIRPFVGFCSMFDVRRSHGEPAILFVVAHCRAPSISACAFVSDRASDNIRTQYITQIYSFRPYSHSIFDRFNRTHSCNASFGSNTLVQYTDTDRFYMRACVCVSP